MKEKLCARHNLNDNNIADNRCTENEKRLFDEIQSLCVEVNNHRDTNLDLVKLCWFNLDVLNSRNKAIANSSSIMNIQPHSMPKNWH